jgi:hypothetical protein
VFRKPPLATLIVALASTLACPASDEEARRPSPLHVEPVADKPTTDEPEPKQPVEEMVIEVATSDPALEPTAVPIVPVSPKPTTVPWREVATFTEPLELVYVSTGVVARSSAGNYDLDPNGQLVLRPGLSLPEGPLVGHFPDDVWSIESELASPTEDGQIRFEYHVLRFDPETLQWLPQPYHGKERWVGEPFAVRKGWQAGVLVRENGRLTRLGSIKSAPDIGVRMGKLLLETIESTSGELYTISQRPTGVHVQGDCADMECVKENAKKLPFGTAWSFSIQVPRQRKSLTIAARVDIADTPTHYLLHFEVGGWKLESLERPPSGLWANVEGGLWMEIDDALWYRSTGGDWFEVALPEGATQLSAALLEHASELWISTTVGGKARIYATAATVAE